MHSINPATGEMFYEATPTSGLELESILQAAEKRFNSWKGEGLVNRVSQFESLALLLEERSKTLATVMTSEMGKRFVEAKAEVLKCASLCRWYASNADRCLSSEERAIDGVQSFVRFDPIGIILAIMPWNFPFWQFFRVAVPAIAAGNVIILKHASNVPRCSELITELFIEAGYQDGVIQNAKIGSREALGLIADPRVRGVSLTGSTQAGRAVAEIAGRYLKPSVLELGGSDPFIVLDDAKIDLTIESAVKGRLINNGQSCIAAKRFLVQRKLFPEFCEKYLAALTSIKLGDPMLESTGLGPLAKNDIREDLHTLVKGQRALGGKILCGGEMPSESGYFYPATLVSSDTHSGPLFEMETFGPVAAVCPFDTDEEAIDLANRSPFGLGSSVWTSDLIRAEAFEEKVEAGSVFVNEIVQSDPRVPFGGVKDSGWGRELSIEGIRAFTNIKSVRRKTI